MNNEIKQGDKVRVSKDAPRAYQKGSIFDYTEHQSIVHEVDDDAAIIGLDIEDSPIYSAPIAIPTKYLIKVDAEAKEAKIKLGDMVRVKGNLHEPFCLDAERHLEMTNIPPHAVSHNEWKVISIEIRRDCAERIYTLKHEDSFIYNIPEDCVELVSPSKLADEMHIRGNEISNMLEAYLKTLSDITGSSDWARYEADLAKEIALKTVNTASDRRPGKVAEYAAQVAKAVVEGLKRK